MMCINHSKPILLHYYISHLKVLDLQMAPVMAVEKVQMVVESVTGSGLQMVAMLVVVLVIVLAILMVLVLVSLMVLVLVVVLALVLGYVKALV